MAVDASTITGRGGEPVNTSAFPKRPMRATILPARPAAAALGPATAVPALFQPDVITLQPIATFDVDLPTVMELIRYHPDSCLAGRRLKSQKSALWRRR